MNSLLKLDYIAHHGVKGMKWGVRKDDQKTFYTNYAYTDDQGGVIKKKDIIKRLKNEIDFYNKNVDEITDKKAKKYLMQLPLEERNKRKKEAVSELNSFLKSFDNIDDDTDIFVEVNPSNGQSKLYIKHNDTLQHGGPGSGRYPKGFKLAKTIAEESKKSTEAVSKAIPDRYDTTKKTHPNYDALSDEFMRNTVNRKNLEMSYANAMGELKSSPSKGKIAKETLQTVGAVLAMAATVASIGLAIHEFRKDDNSPKKNKN